MYAFFEFGGEKHASYLEFEKEMNCLKSKFRNIKTIRLMGGEPLLNADLHKFIRIARTAFPYSNILVVTNGILIQNMSINLINSLRKNAVTIDISQYPPLRKMISENIRFLQRNEIKYKIGPYIETFCVNLTREGEDFTKAYEEYCLSKSCHFLRNGRIYACPRIPMAFEYQNFLGLNITQAELLESSIGLDENISGWDILDKLYNPVPACKICTREKFITWEQSIDADNSDEYFV